MQLVVLLDALLVSLGYLAVCCLDLLFVQVRLSQHGTVQFVAHVVCKDEDLGLVAYMGNLLLHTVNIRAVLFYDIALEEFLAVFEQRLAERRDQLIVDPALLTYLVPYIRKVRILD